MSYGLHHWALGSWMDSSRGVVMFSFYTGVVVVGAAALAFDARAAVMALHTKT
jgi:hypothetical protein